MKEVYIGIDSHKATNVLGFAFEGRDKAELIGRVSADLNRTLDAIRKFMRKHELKKEQLHICYEAGPTGFVLARRLIKLGFDCIVVAPSKIPQKSGDKGSFDISVFFKSERTPSFALFTFPTNADTLQACPQCSCSVIH